MVDKLIDVLLLFLWCIHAARFISCSFCMISACVYNKLFLYISVPPFYYFAFKTTELLEFTSPFPLPKIKGLHKANDFLAKVDYFCWFFHTLLTFAVISIAFMWTTKPATFAVAHGFGICKSRLLCFTGHWIMLLSVLPHVDNGQPQSSLNCNNFLTPTSPFIWRRNKSLHYVHRNRAKTGTFRHYFTKASHFWSYPYQSSLSFIMFSSLWDSMKKSR